MECYALGDPQDRGREGPMHITRYLDRDPLSEGYHAAACQAGKARTKP